MKLGRRGFLKGIVGLGAAAVAAPLITPATTLAAPVAAPLYVPPQNLAYGVPTGRLSLSTDVQAAVQWSEIQGPLSEAIGRRLHERTIPMLLLQNEFLVEHGGRLPAGSEVMVDRQTADRWLRNAIATAGPSAPADLQVASARMLAERQERIDEQQRRWGDYDSAWDTIDGLVGQDDDAPAGAVLTDQFGTWLRASGTPDSEMNDFMRRFALEDALGATVQEEWYCGVGYAYDWTPGEGEG